MTMRLLGGLFYSLSILALSGEAIPSSDAARSLLRALDETSEVPSLAHLHDVSIGNISFEDAILLEAAIAEQQKQLAHRPTFALPEDTHEDLVRIAKSMPTLHVVSSTRHNIMQAAAQIRHSASLISTIPNMKRRQNGLRVMIVGDSMTQGMEGDFTWRYRIWQWFTSNNIAVSMVGPYKGTRSPDARDPPPPSPPPLGPPGATTSNALLVDGTYSTSAAAGWDSDHFSVWGRAAAVDKGLIRNVVSNNPADLMLVMLGFNDLGWFYSDARGLLDSMQTLITNARAANPNLKFAIANVPQRTFIGGRQDLVDNTNTYNTLLANAIPGWSTSQSPVTLVKLRETYDCGLNSCPAGSDGLHPNEYGEYQIARAFSLALYNDFKLGNGALTIPAMGSIPARPLPVPSNFKVFASPQGVTATWDVVYGAYNYDVQQTLNGSNLLDFSPSLVLSNRWDSKWPLDGSVYNVQVRAAAGDTRKGAWTNAISVVAHPQLPSPPQNVRVTPSSGSLDLAWDPPTGPYSGGIIEYNVIWWDVDSCQFLSNFASSGSPVRLSGLTNGHRIMTIIEAWNSNGAGFPSINRVGKPGSGTPGAPSGLVVKSLDQTSVQVNVNNDAGASGYSIWTRNVNQAGSVSQRLNGTSEVPCFTMYFLFPGVWNYEFCISAYNGNLEGPKGQCSVASTPTATSTGSCPTLPQWCPGGLGSGTGVDTGSGGGGGSGGGSGTASSAVAGAASSSAPPNTGNVHPVVTNGQCKGPDCKGGQCLGILCASFGCTGSDCLNGICRGPNCVVGGCLGDGCQDGFCNALGCITKGCIGPQCGADGRCVGLNCLSVGCVGLQCDSSTGTCVGPTCSKGWCRGLGCANGVCESTCSDNGVLVGGSGPTSVPTATPTPTPSPKSTTSTTTCASSTTVSNCAVTCDIIGGDVPQTTTCGSTSCSSTQTGCSLRGKVTSVFTTWSCPTAGAVTDVLAPSPDGGGSGGTTANGGGSGSGTTTTGNGGGTGTTCKFTTAPTGTTFNLVSHQYQECQLVGSTSVCQNYYSVDTADQNGLNCNNLGSSTQTGGDSLPYRNNMSPQPQSFAVARAHQQCNGQTIKFTLQCDGTYLATVQDNSSGAMLPGTAVCKIPVDNSGKFNGQLVTCPASSGQNLYQVQLVCKGDICFN